MILALWLIGCLPPFEGDALGECVDRVDNDGDGLVDCDDPDCDGSRACRFAEVCDNGVDEDGDGRVDCDDPDCADEPWCAPELCDNGIDDNGNGLVDCEEPSCGCVGRAEWRFDGEGTVGADAYVGELAMRFTVTAPGGGGNSVGDRLCEARFTMASSAVGDTCTSCDFAFHFDSLPLDTNFGGGGTSGSYCDDWQDFSPGGPYNPITWFDGLGWDPDNAGAEIRTYSTTYGYTSWDALSGTDGTLDGDRFTWTWVVGEYAY
ncbi:MAG: hypothetical protein EP330_28830 [Deltaproteobacteria bacterium]|nr:MAG: hypothetical protein EP330_28830 [Deltaproteobacteria bacterium]